MSSTPSLILMPFAHSSRQKYVPRHRQPRRARFARSAPGVVVRTSVLVSSVGVTAIGVPVVDGALDGGAAPVVSDVTTAPPGRLSAAQLEDRAQVVSRAASRERSERTDRQKAAVLSQAEGPAVARSEDLSKANPREIGRALLPEYGFSADQFGCLDALYVSESNWRVDADNPTSSAYGIPQALTSLHDLPPDYHTSAEAQLRWGLEYIQASYGTPCAAWEFKQANSWY